MLDKIRAMLVKFLHIKVDEVQPPMNISNSLQAAADLYAHHQFDAVESICLAVLKCDALNYDALRLLALANFQKGNHIHAIELLEKALAINSQSVQAHLDLAVAFYNSDQFESSLQKFGDVLAVEPNHFSALKDKANILLILKKYQLALESCNKALAINQNDIEVLDIKGSALLGLGLYEESLLIHKDILLANPSHTDAKSKQGLARYKLGEPLNDSSNLMALSDFFGTDKFEIHQYMQHYEHHFSALRLKEMNILEIGVGGYNNPVAGGASARLWKNYFANSNIFSIDIYDKSFHEEDRIKIFKGSQADNHFLNNVAAEVGSFDIIIDDGSHLNEHVISAFKALFPYLNEGGIYVIEDTQTAYWPDWGGSTDLTSPNTSMGFMKSLIDGLNHEEFISQRYSPTYFDEHITGMHFYHNFVFINKGKNKEGSNRLVYSLQESAP
jgi:tetratricopeptide (TPR) repeat protein